MAETPLEERVDRERGNMAVVEHDGMPERDRALIVGIRRKHFEELPRPGPIVTISLNDLPAINHLGTERRRLRQDISSRNRLVPALDRTRTAVAERGAANRAGVLG